MNDPREVDSLVAAVGNQIGLDVYAFYEGDETRRLVPETVIVAIVTALVVEYLKGLLGAKEAGEARAKSLREIVTRIRGGQDIGFEVMAPSLRDQINRAKQLPRAEHLRYVPAFVADLVDAGVPVQTATAIADAVGGEVARLGR